MRVPAYAPDPPSSAHPERRAGQNVSPDDNWSRRALIALLFAPMPWIMRLFAFVHFAGIRARHPERFPRSGPVIVVANHPATWADVLVLHVALGRKLHFLADQHLFRPRVREWLLQVYGALPVLTSGEPSEREARNADTFRRCRRLLERGEVVAIFPEGVSETDRSVRRFRTGAARIALGGLEAAQRVPVLPIGIHYLDRVAFRTRVLVNIGDTVSLPPLHGGDAADRSAWIALATTRLEQAVEALILDLPEPSFRVMVEEVVPLLATRSASDVDAFDDARRVAARLAGLERDRPWDFAAISLHARRHRRLRKALGLACLPPAKSSRARLALLAVAIALGAAPAMVGLAIHALPAWVTQRVARHFDPTRVTLMRIGVGWVSFSLWYLGMAGVAALFVSPWIALAVPLVAASLGAHALFWSDGWREVRARLRWRTARRGRLRMVARLHRERATLVALVERADAPARAPRIPEMAR